MIPQKKEKIPKKDFSAEIAEIKTLQEVEKIKIEEANLNANKLIDNIQNIVKKV